MRPRVVISQRNDYFHDRNEARDALDVRLSKLFWELGYLPIPLSSHIDEPDRYLRLLQPNGLVLSGGNDIGESRERDLLERSMLEFSIETMAPILGICRGMQYINFFQKGNLTTVHGHVKASHPIRGPLCGEQKRIVNSYHSCGIRLPDLGLGLQAVAWSDDGIIEAIRHRDYPWLGIMWHPEREDPFQKSDKEIIANHFSKN